MTKNHKQKNDYGFSVVIFVLALSSEGTVNRNYAEVIVVTLCDLFGDVRLKLSLAHFA